MQDQESLLFQCFKARYFPRCHFLEATDSPNSSFTWKSIMAAKPILQRGSCWRVGNRAAIRILKDAWIPNHPTNKVLHLSENIDEEMTVSELIDLDSSEVKVSCGTAAGKGIGLGRMLKGGNVWKTLWKLKVPNKIKVFGWRACCNILPTQANLAQKWIIQDNRCEACKTEPETGIHALWNCGVSQDVWAGCSARLQKCLVGQAGMLQLLDELIKQLPPDELEQFLVQDWLIWHQWNVMIQGKQLQAPEVLN
uniref:Reverse transcriptase zinc-binding domain-containing protein n=1 Tax=Quercus lobata TaxID=97700 RepID=A0A7N2LK24_QUELO